MKKVLIAGSGIGGMTAALLLKKNGMDVTICEKSHKLGGRLSYIREQDFKIDEGPTIVLLPEMLQSILDEAGVARTEYELLKMDPLYTLHYKDGSTYRKYSSKEKQLEELKEKFPGDTSGFLRFMKDMDISFPLGQKAFLEKSFTFKKDFWTGSNIRALMKLKAYKSVYKSLQGYFKDERLLQAYSLQTLYIGGNPYESPALYSLISYSEHQHGIYYVKGGYASLAAVLEKALRRLGVAILKDSELTGFEVSGLNAVSAEVNGKKIAADYFVLNGDFPAVSHLLNRYMPKKKPYTPSSSCLLLYFGLNKIYHKADVHQFFMGSDFSSHMKAVFKTKELPEDPSIYAFHPSVIDGSLAPEGKGVLYALVPVPSGEGINWKEQDAFIEKMIDELEKRGFPGLREAILWQKVKTPLDAMKEGLFDGGSFGLAPSLNQSGVFRPQVKPSILQNVYAAGASIHPGGGVPIVMQGAKLMASELLEDAAKYREVKTSG
ncbi:phytoene desaturase [Metabacillus sp. GX 13764]|uniref:phytoene desaturase family protein n=1 Tax=Metabacillus kandeliae TaxID=2900151 RepID=UPI001E42CCF3|nr:phytoene desaturase family protein [Metabacillus kandeliae]MCD7034912.1 phytoene desaturase [Metabacillus kandeliae]